MRADAVTDDGSWWYLTCRRSGPVATVIVQRLGSSSAETTSVASSVGSIDSTKPVQLGSKGIPSDADQFHGLVDDLTVRIG